MREKYGERYGRQFNVLMHGDNIARFTSITPFRLVGPEECWIVGTGVFDHHRLPLLIDLEYACDLLTKTGRRVRATIFAVNYQEVLSRLPRHFKHVAIEPCPTHNVLASHLIGADLLFLPERFDESANDIRLCVSSKTHLFMFSGKPIVVYSDPRAGVVRYAEEEGWAAIVDRRNPRLLANTIERILLDDSLRQNIVRNAHLSAMRNHDLTAIQSSFLNMIWFTIHGTHE
jgi:glycosyltransferase involved in cell wall biosynthesis